MASAAGAVEPRPAAVNRPSDVLFAARVALAAAACFIVAAVFHLEHANLAVWTTHMVMSQYTFTAFQKGIERALGRGLGIVAGLGLTTLLYDQLLLNLAVEAILLLCFFYLYFAGRLAYAFLNAGLYVVAVNHIGQASYDTVAHTAYALFIAVVVGVIVADLVLWITRAERDLTIHAGDTPLTPLRADWINRCLMLIVTIELVRLVVWWLRLPAEAAMISVLIMTVTPDLHALLLKGELRLLGAIAGGLWAIGSFVLVVRAPHLPLMACLLFLGIFIAAYLTRTSGPYAYGGMQMGLVLALTLVVPADEIGTITGFVERMEGVGVALAVSVVVGGLWPWFALSTPAGSRNA